jgi:hypothetical protein
MCGRANGNSREARSLDAEHHPQRTISPQKLFATLYQRLSESGSFAPSLNAYCNVILIKKNSGAESASELYRPSDRRLSAKLVPTLADRRCRVVSVTNHHGR